MAKCPLCRQHFVDKMGVISHVSKSHDQEVPESVTIKQFVFNVTNRYNATKTHGRSVLFGEKTLWNEEKGRYERFSSDREVEAYKRQFRARMMKKYGKEHLLADPDVQRKMLENRKISGKYKFLNGDEKVFTGSYERDFFEVMDLDFSWDARDIIAPAPCNIQYIHPETGEEHIYIPDVWIPSLNLIVEIKSDTNMHYRARDLHIEKAKDRAAEASTYNYVKVVEKEYDDFVEMVLNIRASLSENAKDVK